MDLQAVTARVDKEHDSCGIFAQADKTGKPSRQTVTAGLEALVALRHRAGYVNGEGDGCGLLLDLPRVLWRRWLQEVGQSAHWTSDNRFAVLHLLLTAGADTVQHVEALLATHGLQVLLTQPGRVSASALGALASGEATRFVQMAVLTPVEEDSADRDAADAILFRATRQIDALPGVHVASFSRTTCVYKVVGDGTTLPAYYDDLRDPDCTSSFVLAHTRYSTNTSTSLFRVQPFPLIGHNGEINTIARFYEEAGMAGVELDPDASDSQMVDRMLHHLVSLSGWSLFEAALLLFPPIIHEVKQMPVDLADMYMFLRSLWGPFAQGPAAVIMRWNDEALVSVDALGLRPLWVVETESAWCFSSEQVIIPVESWVSEPKPLSPGEKVGLSWGENGIELRSCEQVQDVALQRLRGRFQFGREARNLHFAASYGERREVAHAHRDRRPLPFRQAAFGWREHDVRALEFHAQSASEPIQSLGSDSPLAALDSGVCWISDFLHESVAVVTNPAVDREREIEHFSTRTVLGRRPSLFGLYKQALRVELASPLLLEELPPDLDIPLEDVQAIANRRGTLAHEDALAALHAGPAGTVEILIHRRRQESVASALQRFAGEAVDAVLAGANAIVLDDRLQFLYGDAIDPFLSLAAVHQALLRPTDIAPEAAGPQARWQQTSEHLRRQTSLILRCAGLRNLHDIMVALGLGADAVTPYLMWEMAAANGSAQAVENLHIALCKGIEEVISTLGIHELRGYERLFSAIGLHAEVAQWLAVPTFCSTQVGYSFADMEAQARIRQQWHDASRENEFPRQRLFQLYPRIWKAAGQVAAGELAYAEFVQRLQGFERDHPLSLRHVLEFVDPPADADRLPRPRSLDQVDTRIDGHAYPLVISSMSFGSQGETAYRAYAEAAFRTNIVALNGEGGEIKDLLTRYPRNRGRQVASGRFGVNAELCNGAYVLEIKIGQGAKPGEGGHLPGSKVTEQVALARNAAPGVDLISPSNNHDIYSIEDLAQVVHELHVVNPNAKVAVKVPVVPNIGTIAVGIVKAGADVVTLSGFDGGTGAARAHAIRHVGLPMEIGVVRAHDALCAAGLRDVAEIWVDGGMKSGVDVMKAILLGANRVGFGTMAMVAIGCTSCRACHKDTCHVGIATQLQDAAEAAEKGVKSFSPREWEQSVAQLQRFFTAIGEHVRGLTAALGAVRTQDLVGRRDLLCQRHALGRLDVAELLRQDIRYAGRGTRVQTLHGAVAEAHTEQVVGEMTMAVGTELMAAPRALGADVAGWRVRRGDGAAQLRVREYVSAGNGFGAYHAHGMVSVVHGGGGDGVGKSAFGGKIVILKRRSSDGVWRGGSVGKGLAYGAQRGLFIIQGDADARAGIRLSGADIVIGGEVSAPLADDRGWIGSRANLKGFAFEYMTSGRAVVLGDPGPWICSGMTGGSVYLRLQPEVGLTEQALRRRVGKGAKVSLRYLDGQGEADIAELLTAFQKELRHSGQWESAKRLQPLLNHPVDHFLMVRSGGELTDQSIATE